MFAVLFAACASKATPTPSPLPAALFLEVASPANESIVSSQEVEVKGRTTPDAVVTVNSQVASVDADGNFSGSQLSSVITVIYVPA